MRLIINGKQIEPESTETLVQNPDDKPRTKKNDSITFCGLTLSTDDSVFNSSSFREMFEEVIVCTHGGILSEARGP